MTKEEDKSNVEEIDCLEAIELLYAYLDGELDDEELAKYEHHMGHCRSCYSRSELETALNKRIEQSVKGEVPKTLQNRIRHLVDKF
ncbi:anti-sigma factor family protein [Kaarinaea lacus]